jgi:hypothetical protein
MSEGATMYRSFFATTALWFALFLIGVLAGCAEQPQQLAGAGANGQAAPPGATSQPPPPEIMYGLRGDRLSPGNYRVLVSGNTLFRPLANGTETAVYVAPDGSERMRISTQNGASATDTGKQTLRGDVACWQWQKAGGGREMCFDYYWNGRLLTMVEKTGQMQPAQFLIKAGNSENL